MRGGSLLILCTGMAVTVAAGCGIAPATVSGEVTVDGSPLKNGVISFVPADGKGEPVTVEVKEGKYELKVMPGPKWIQVSAPKVVGKHREYNSPDAPFIEQTQESLPARYNSKTQLEFEVKPGRNTKDLHLEVKGRKG